jgi:hypothetical protein
LPPWTGGNGFVDPVTDSLAVGCATNPVCAATATALGLGAYIIYKTSPIGPAQVSAGWIYTGPRFILQTPTITLMAKGGKQNIDNEYTREVKALGRQVPDPCKYLRDRYNSTSDPIERAKINKARKYFGCDSKDRY